MKTQTTTKLTLKKETIRVLNANGQERQFATTVNCSYGC